jgi:hypothetical protein
MQLRYEVIVDITQRHRVREPGDVGATKSPAT